MDILKINHGIIEDFTIVLSTRDYRHLGQLTGIKSDTVNYNGNLNSANEMSLSLSKYDFVYGDKNIDDFADRDVYFKEKENIWNQIVDFKLIWVKELDQYFEIKVSIEDALETHKNITATSLCEAELSQTNIYNLEINSEIDIARTAYDVNFPTVFYRDWKNPEKYNEIWLKDTEKVKYYVYKEGTTEIDEEKTLELRKSILKSSSLLHRALDKAPHYSIKYVDESLWNIQRVFSVSGTSIYDFFIGECSEQFNCLFTFDSNDRSISVYDLYTVCKSCNHRGDFYDKCPECEGTDLKYFGKDTTIFVDKNNLTDSIQLEVDTDSIKNCFKLSAGDDLMTATIRTINPSGSDYIYRVSDFQRQDMPKELVDKLDEYDKEYNENVEAYEGYVEEIWNIQAQIDELEHTLMPTLEQAEVTAQTEVDKISKAFAEPEGTEKSLSPIAVTSFSVSETTVDSAVKNFLKVFVKSGYVKIELNNTKYTKETDSEGKVVAGKWSGTIVITNYSDKEDVAEITIPNINITDNYQEFVEQKIIKRLAEEHSEEGSVFDVLAYKDLDKFKAALNLYCRQRVISFRDAIEGAILILTEMGHSEEGADLYESFYVPYYDKLKACEDRLKWLDDEIVRLEGLKTEPANEMEEIRTKLNFESYLGKYYPIFCSYRREDTYENSNYISDGLSNSDLIKKAKEFLDVAKDELVKASEPKYTLSSTLYNLLAMKEFKPILEYFELGNWIRVKVDKDVYRLRLIGFGLNFGSLQSLSVEFSNITRFRDVVYETHQILQAAQSMSTNYSYVAKQAEKGNDANDILSDLTTNGLNSAIIQIKSNDKEEVTQSKNGILCRSFDDETGTYDKKQVRITHNGIVFTNDNWATAKTAIGEHVYKVYDSESNQMIDKVGYGVTTEFLTSDYLTGKTIIGGEIRSSNYSNGTNGKPEAGSYIDLEEGNFSFAAGGLTFDGNKLYLKEEAVKGAIEKVGITAENLKIKAKNIDGKIVSDQIESIDASKVKGTVSSSVNATDIIGTIQSDRITNTLNSKTITDSSFSGDINVASVITRSDAVPTGLPGLTTDVTLGGVTLKFINGILVEVKQEETIT